MKYVDPDGKFTFDYNAFCHGIILGNCNGVAAVFKDALGQTGNFISNIFNSKSTSELYVEATLNIGDVALSGTMSIQQDGSSMFEISKPESIALDTLEGALGAPCTINSKELTIEGILVKTPIIDIGGKVGGKVNDNSTATITLGVSASKGVSEVMKGGLGLGINITASTQNGPFGTIQNKQNDSITNNVENYKYFNSLEFIKSNIME